MSEARVYASSMHAINHDRYTAGKITVLLQATSTYTRTSFKNKNMGLWEKFMRFEFRRNFLIRPLNVKHCVMSPECKNKGVT